MEEDIKILEALNETLMKDKFIIPKEPRIWCEALENAIKTIKAHKELEYKYDKALSNLVQAEHENKELKEENEVWKNNYYEQKEFNNKQALYITENFIPVALVEEKIEELKEKADEDNKEEYIKIQALQELLEKRE